MAFTDSAPGAWTRVCGQIYPVIATAPWKQRSDRSSAAYSVMRQKRVLLVEDTFDNRAIYEMVLNHAGYQVFVAENGALGVQAARDHHPDLILMDLSMPVMDGWEALRALKADPELTGIPVCALSAHVLREGDLHCALEAGFTDYLTKPILPTAVLGTVRTIIGSAV